MIRYKNINFFFLLLTIIFLVGSNSSANADAIQTKYFTQVNKVLDSLQKNYPNSKGFNAGRIMYKTSSLKNSIITDIKGMCTLYKDAYKDSKLTNPELNNIVSKYWVGEQQMVDWVLSNSGNDKDTLNDFMLVRFTGLTTGINTYCPTYFAITSKQFSDRLFVVYTNYINTLP
jgi:hypothetical protein